MHAESVAFGMLDVAEIEVESELENHNALTLVFLHAQSVSFGELFSPESGAIFELEFTNPLVAPAPGSTPFTPEQIHVTLGGECSHAPQLQGLEYAI